MLSLRVSLRYLASPNDTYVRNTGSPLVGLECCEKGVEMPKISDLEDKEREGVASPQPTLANKGDWRESY